MASLLKRGGTYFVRLTIPRDRWADVGKAMGAASGIRREVVRTLQTTSFREAQRRRDEGLAAASEMVDASLRKHRLAPLTDWTATWMNRAIERRSQMQAGRGKVNGWTEGPSGEEAAVTEADLTGETVEAEARDLETRKGPEVAHRFSEIALGSGMSIAEAGRQWIASLNGQVREGTWRGYQASIAGLGAYMAAYEACPSLEAVSLSTVSRRIAGEMIAARRMERASETVQRDFSAWNGLWRWAVRRGYTDLNPRDFASSDGHMVEDVGENAHVQHCIPHGVADGVLARDDADGVERHAFEGGAVARAVVAPHERRILAHGHVENPVQVVLNSPMTARQGEQALGRIGVSKQVELAFRRCRTGPLADAGAVHPADGRKAGPAVVGQTRQSMQPPCCLCCRRP